MNKLTRAILVTLVLFIVSACGAKSKNLSLEKEGFKFTKEPEVTFYVPNACKNDDEVSKIYSEEDPNKLIYIEYIFGSNGEEWLSYKNYIDETDNDTTHKDELYIAHLEQVGASGVTASQINLESGITVSEVKGSYVSKGTKFKHIVYFAEGEAYIYGYEALNDKYDEHESVATVFIRSLTILES